MTLLLSLGSFGHAFQTTGEGTIPPPSPLADTIGSEGTTYLPPPIEDDPTVYEEGPEVDITVDATEGTPTPPRPRIDTSPVPWRKLGADGRPNVITPPLPRASRTESDAIRSTELDDPKLTREQLSQELRKFARVFDSQSRVLRGAYRLVAPSVVHLKAHIAKGRRTTNPKNSVEETGAGVVFQYQGKNYILTNQHILAGALLRDIRVKTPEGRTYLPRRVWVDAATDIAVIRVDNAKLTPLDFSDSDKSLIGDFVLVIGSPFGLEQSLSMGIISARGRRDLELPANVRYQDFIQTDAAVNPGNSGGPLVNTRGELVGIVTAIASESGGHQGVAFAIPGNMAYYVAKNLIDHGYVPRGILGITLDSDFTQAKATAIGMSVVTGARVSDVAPQSPAALAGMKVGDVVLEYNGVPVVNDSHLIVMVSNTPVAKKNKLKVRRAQSEITVDLRLMPNGE